MCKRILLLGFGDLARHVLNLLSLHESQHEIIVSSRDEVYTRQKINLVKFVAAQLNKFPNITYARIQLESIDETAQKLREIRPDIIFSSVTLQSWRILTLLPKPVFEELDKAEFGPWLPMHLSLMFKLMQAVKKADLPNTLVVNAAFPDAVNAILSRVGLSPFVGIGNVANLIPALRYSCAQQLKIPTEVHRVNVLLCAQHYFSHRIPRSGNTGGCEYNFRVLLDDKDVTSSIDIVAVFASIPKEFKRVGGTEGQILTAASAYSVLHALLNDTKQVVHAPGPNGLVGGYPVRFTSENGDQRISAQVLETAFPEPLSVLIHSNDHGLRMDGIDQIDADGTVHFNAEKMAILSKYLGYSKETMRLDQVDEFANELQQKFETFRKSLFDGKDK